MEAKQIREEVEKIEKFLNGGLLTDYKAQIIIAGRDKKAWKWFPGNQPATALELGSMIANAGVKKNVIGFTGGFFENREMPAQKQVAFSTACGIDVDAVICEDGNVLDIEYLDEDTWVKTVEKAIDEVGDICSIRTSSGGRGLHFIVRFKEAIKNATPTVRKKAVLPIIDRIERVGLKVDKVGQVLYFLGGLQTWLHLCKNKWDAKSFIEKEDTAYMSHCPTCGMDKIETDMLTDDGRELIDILYSNNIIPSRDYVPAKIDIYVKHVFEALKDTKFAFETCSPMAEGKNWHANGFMVVNQSLLKIYTNADNKIVKEYLILSY